MRSIPAALSPSVPFVLAAHALPIGLLAQFLTAGQALFRDGGFWGVHAALGAGGDALSLSLHPFNGALLLVASLVLLAKVERWRGAVTALAAAASAGCLLPDQDRVRTTNSSLSSVADFGINDHGASS